MKKEQTRKLDNNLSIKTFVVSKTRSYLYLSIIFLNLFLSSCSSSNERRSEAFLKKLLLEEGGIYTLAGDKPITDILIFIGSQDDICLECISSESLEKLEYIDDCTLENWNSWKQYAKNRNFSNFRFIERPSPHDTLHIMYLLVNIKNLKSILEKYKTKFSEETGLDYPVEQILSEIEDPKSIFWDRAFENHYLSGLLHGYGEENSRYFTRVAKGEVKPVFSDHQNRTVSNEKFPLPIFAITDDDQQCEKYKEQRIKIQQIYRNKNFLKKTLELLGQGA